MGCGERNAAAVSVILARAAVGAQYAAAGDDVAFKTDHAVNVAERCSFDDTVVVDHRFDELVRGFRGKQHLSAIGADQSLVVGQCIERALIDSKANQFVAVQVERDRIARAKRYVAAGGDDRTFVFDLRANQRNVTAIGNDLSNIAHFTRRAIFHEAIAPRQKVAIAQAQRGSH